VNAYTALDLSHVSVSDSAKSAHVSVSDSGHVCVGLGTCACVRLGAVGTWFSPVERRGSVRQTSRAAPHCLEAELSPVSLSNVQPCPKRQVRPSKLPLKARQAVEDKLEIRVAVVPRTVA